jgi:hypothetical protein
MIEHRSLKPVLDILNYEGCILGLKTDPIGNLYLSSFLKDGSENVFYSTNAKELKAFIESNMTIKDIYLKSPDFLVKFKFRNDVKTFLKEDFQNDLQCGSDLYKDIPESMKSEQFEKNTEAKNV